ncbi:MAG: diguanylate cyclase [Nitrospiraceae bacterium]|nr:diguanylate cyclase [Nitrospiraceae bacterium]
MRLKDIITPNPKFIEDSQTVSEAIKKMIKNNIGSVLIEDKSGKLVGILTESDVIKLMFLGHEGMKVSEVIPKSKLITADVNEDVYSAMEVLAKHNIKHIPVVENGRVVGIVSASDIMKRVSPLAFVDPLTKLLNRAYLESVIYKYRFSKAKFGVCMIDVDDFKEINDTYGHAAGDEALKAIAKGIVQSVRPYDDVIRYGGEEFLVMLYRIQDLDELKEIAKRTRKNIGSIKLTDYSSMKLTASIGVSYCEKGNLLKKCIKVADKAMYEAKKLGKNRVIVGKESI